jgi:hypothetical protein
MTVKSQTGRYKLLICWSYVPSLGIVRLIAPSVEIQGPACVPALGALSGGGCGGQKIFF